MAWWSRNQKRPTGWMEEEVALSPGLVQIIDTFPLLFYHKNYS